jgi:hypothetical protein
VSLEAAYSFREPVPRDANLSVQEENREVVDK